MDPLWGRGEHLTHVAQQRVWGGAHGWTGCDFAAGRHFARTKPHASAGGRTPMAAPRAREHVGPDGAGVQFWETVEQ